MIRASAVRVVFLSSLLLSFSSVARAWDDRPEELYHMCTQCHGTHTEGNELVGAPSISGLPQWYLEAELTKFHTNARGAHPKDINGMRMHPIGRTLEDSNIKTVAQYVAALPRPSTPDTVKGSLVKGEASYQVCTACHGAHAEGNQVVNAPPLVEASDWYMLTQLRNFKNRARGGDPTADPTGAAMQGIAGTLSDEQMIDVVAYINTFKPAK